MAMGWFGRGEERGFWEDGGRRKKERSIVDEDVAWQKFIECSQCEGFRAGGEIFRSYLHHSLREIRLRWAPGFASEHYSNDRICSGQPFLWVSVEYGLNSRHHHKLKIIFPQRNHVRCLSLGTSTLCALWRYSRFKARVGKGVWVVGCTH